MWRPIVNRPRAAVPDAVVLPDGFVIRGCVADQASTWLATLMSEDATPGDELRCKRWRALAPEHERAWRHLEAVCGRIKSLEAGAAYRSLSPMLARGAQPPADPTPPRLASPGRRSGAGLLLWLGAAGLAGWGLSRTSTGRQMLADYRSGIGEVRVVMLNDGSRVVLNSGSAIDVRFDRELRRVRLLSGEVMVTTGHARHGVMAETRPFVVDTPQGRILALGTRFDVRLLDDLRSRVSVFESAVALRPADAPAQVLRLQAGQSGWLTRVGVGGLTAASAADAAWTRSQIIASDMRLGDFVAELARHRHGLVQCDPAVAGLRFSGVFPLHDTDRILTILPNVLPVQVRMRTSLWARVEAADSGLVAE